MEDMDLLIDNEGRPLLLKKKGYWDRRGRQKGKAKSEGNLVTCRIAQIRNGEYTEADLWHKVPLKNDDGTIKIIKNKYGLVAPDDQIWVEEPKVMFDVEKLFKASRGIQGNLRNVVNVNALKVVDNG